MTIAIQSIARCPGGGNHIELTVSVGGGANRTLRLNRSDLDSDLTNEDAFIARIRSAVKEAGASTPQQIQTALVGKTFQI